MTVVDSSDIGHDWDTVHSARSRHQSTAGMDLVSI